MCRSSARPRWSIRAGSNSGTKTGPGLPGFTNARNGGPRSHPRHPRRRASAGDYHLTAFDKFALEAFNAGAIDYLVKPVGQKRLADAVERVRRVTEREAIDRFSRLQNFADVAGAGPGPRKIVGKVGEEYFLLAVDEILAFQAEGDLVWIITAPRKYLATQTLKALEQRLAGASFRRIHRSALVNLDHIRKVSALTSQRWLITLSNRQEFVASKRQARGVRGLLRW